MKKRVADATTWAQDQLCSLRGRTALRLGVLVVYVNQMLLMMAGDVEPNPGPGEEGGDVEPNPGPVEGRGGGGRRKRGEEKEREEKGRARRGLGRWKGNNTSIVVSIHIQKRER